MKCLYARISALLILVPAIASAGWQVAKPIATSPSEPFFQAGAPSARAYATPSDNGATFPDQFSNLGHPAAVYAISVSGSLKENLERIMDRYHWKIVWKVAYDYNFDGRITGSSLPNVIEKLLAPFPLQATMFMSNRTMIVTQRKI